MTTPERRDGVHDFDFLHGTWTIHNRRLRAPLSGSAEWYEFDGRAVERPIWDGQGNLEEYDARLPDATPLRGLALRLYEPLTRRWSIHWSSSANGTLDAPMIGDFRNGRGEFYSREDFQGRSVFVRFVWTSTGTEYARWEQSYSADAGCTWEVNWVMEFTRVADSGDAANGCCPMVELRQYTLHPGMRDTLISLFEREFIESQERAGMRVIAQFRDIDRPDMFVWLRGFSDMASRAAALSTFYDGPVWLANRTAANATIVDSDDVRLLRPVVPGTGLPLGTPRPAHGLATPPSGLVVATIYTLKASVAADFPALFQQRVTPHMTATGARPLGMFETDASANTFPRLPVREGEHSFVWFARFDDIAAYERHVAALAADRQWVDDVQAVLARQLASPSETWRLAPTARSLPWR
ncbi:MAG: NIPSNAP family protein [bacterium]